MPENIILAKDLRKGDIIEEKRFYRIESVLNGESTVRIVIIDYNNNKSIGSVELRSTDFVKLVKENEILSRI